MGEERGEDEWLRGHCQWMVGWLSENKWSNGSGPLMIHRAVECTVDPDCSCPRILCLNQTNKGVPRGPRGPNELVKLRRCIRWVDKVWAQLTSP